MNSFDLTKKLISIPSYVDGNVNEIEIGEFILAYLKNFDFLRVTKQNVGNGRFNVLVQDKFPTTLLICGHIDTVEPKNKEQLVPTVKNNKIYGLGASDMKSTVACILACVQRLEQTKGIGFLFYVDEEYDFAGMSKFIKEYRKSICPKLIIGEGTDCKITNGCRGLIEIKFRLFGKTGHAAKSDSGNNAIVGAQIIANAINDFVQKSVDPMMGKSSLNIASINGGLNLGLSNGEIQIGRQGNNIADYCEFIVDIRPSTKNLNAKMVCQLAKKVASKLRLEIDCQIRHDKNGWISPIAKLPKVITEKYSLDPNYQRGYLDTQMLNEAFDVPCFGFGAGLSTQAHKSDECVPMENIQICEQFYTDLIINWKGGE